MVKLVDTHALGACASRRGGSSPSSRTRKYVVSRLLGSLVMAAKGGEEKH